MSSIRQNFGAAATLQRSNYQDKTQTFECRNVKIVLARDKIHILNLLSHCFETDLQKYYRLT